MDELDSNPVLLFLEYYVGPMFLAGRKHPWLRPCQGKHPFCDDGILSSSQKTWRGPSSAPAKVRSENTQPGSPGAPLEDTASAFRLCRIVDLTFYLFCNPRLYYSLHTSFWKRKPSCQMDGEYRGWKESLKGKSVDHLP